MIFHDITIVAGQRVSARQHESSSLVRAAVEVFRDMLERYRNGFERPIPIDNFRHIRLRWTSEKTGAALATFWSGQVPLTTSALVSSSEADRECLASLHGMLLRLFHGSPVEPGFDLLAVTERPLIASAVLPIPPSLRHDMEVVADMETCMAAAFFESLETK